ncbi:hypothetical protein GCM10010498_09960 [Streptomyces cavourensis]|nr:hypothetical protein GCM10010498_09960 [Streptomyces cavourensis]
MTHPERPGLTPGPGPPDPAPVTKRSGTFPERPGPPWRPGPLTEPAEGGTERPRAEPGSGAGAMPVPVHG